VPSVERQNPRPLTSGEEKAATVRQPVTSTLASLSSCYWKGKREESRRKRKRSGREKRNQILTYPSRKMVCSGEGGRGKGRGSTSFGRKKKNKSLWAMGTSFIAGFSEGKEKRRLTQRCCCPLFREKRKRKGLIYAMEYLNGSVTGKKGGGKKKGTTAIPIDTRWGDQKKIPGRRISPPQREKKKKKQHDLAC